MSSRTCDQALLVRVSLHQSARASCRLSRRASQISSTCRGGWRGFQILSCPHPPPTDPGTNRRRISRERRSLAEVRGGVEGAGPSYGGEASTPASRTLHAPQPSLVDLVIREVRMDRTHGTSRNGRRGPRLVMATTRIAREDGETTTRCQLENYTFEHTSRKSDVKTHTCKSNIETRRCESLDTFLSMEMSSRSL